MSETTQFKAPKGTAARVHRREFLCIAPSAVPASSIPLGLPCRDLQAIRSALAALWDQEEGSGSIIKPTTAERLDSFVSGCNAGLISASRSDLILEENQRRCVGLWSDIWPRFGSIDVDVRFSEHGPLQTQTLTERAFLLLGEETSIAAISKGPLQTPR